MRKFKVISASLVAASSFGFAACGDDPEKPGTDATIEATPETTPETETTPEVTPETVEETETIADPCDPNPCTAKAAICNANGEKVTYGAGVCAEGDCTYPETVAACGAGETCNAGECIGAGDACDYAFNKRISYVTSIEVAAASGADACCFDFGGPNANIDNALGGLLATLGAIPTLNFDVNETLAEQIASGGLVLLLETKNVTDIANSTGVVVNGFYGADGDADATNNASGTAEFIVNPSSFVEGTSQPLISFPGSSITSGVLAAGPSVFRLSIPLLGTVLDLAVDATRLETSVSGGADGADGGLAFGGEEGGKLGGYVAIQSLADAFNTYLDASCACMTKTDPSKPYIGTSVSGGMVKIAANFAKANADGCIEEDESTCKQIAEYVPLAGGIIAPDIDGDNDGTRESLSVGVRIKATSARVTGVDGCTP